MRAVRNAGSSGFYSNIRRICDERHITIAELERKAGLGNGVVRKWDNASPTLRTAIAVADYLGVTLDDLVRGGREVIPPSAFPKRDCAFPTEKRL